MEKGDLEDVPEVAVPEGYRLRTFRPGDEIGLAHIYTVCELGNESPGAIRHRMLEHPCFAPERIFLLEWAGEAVATAAAWVEPDQPGYGYLRMVGVLPEHRRKRLGVTVALAAIAHTRGEGLRRQRLRTDDWRHVAIGMYLDLGFVPLLLDATHATRWEIVGNELGRPDLVSRGRPRAARRRRGGL